MADRTADRNIERGATITAAGLPIRMLARVLFLFVAGTLFGTKLFGAYVLATALIELAVSLGSLSTKRTLFPLLDRHEHAARPLAHSLIDAALLVACASIALGALIMAAAFFLPASTIAGSRRALVLLLPMIAGQALLDLFLAAARWKQTVRYEVISRSIIEPYALLLVSSVAWAIGLRNDGLIAGYWGGTLSALGYAIFATRRNFGGFRVRSYRPEPELWRQILKAATANSAVDLLSALYTRVDLYLVGLMLGQSPAGIYGMAKQLTTPIRQVRQSFDGLLIPAVARTLTVKGMRATGEAVASATRVMLVLQLPILITLVAAGQPLLRWLGHDFVRGYWALLALALAEVIQAAFSVADLIFVYLRPHVGLAITLVTIIVGIVAAVLFIPALGLTGAGLSVLTAYVSRALLRAFVLRTRFDYPILPRYQAAPLAAASVAAAVAVALQAAAGTSHYPLALLALVSGLGIYCAGLLVWIRVCGAQIRLAGFSDHNIQL